MKEVQTGQILLTAKVDMMMDLLRTLVGSKSSSPVSTANANWKLPLETLEHFDEMEASIREDKAEKESLVSSSTFRI